MTWRARELSMTSQFLDLKQSLAGIGQTHADKCPGPGGLTDPDIDCSCSGFPWTAHTRDPSGRFLSVDGDQTHGIPDVPTTEILQHQAPLHGSRPLNAPGRYALEDGTLLGHCSPKDLDRRSRPAPDSVRSGLSRTRCAWSRSTRRALGSSTVR